MAGRPTKLTPQVQARIVQAIVGGLMDIYGWTRSDCDGWQGTG